MTKRPVLSAASAEEDLIAIWSYVATENPNAADRLLDRIEARFTQLALFPHSGAARNDIAPNIRQLVIENYLIFYRIDGGSIVLLRVLHGHRDVGAEDFQP